MQRKLLRASSLRTEMILNTLAFAIIIGTQQLVILPSMAGRMGGSAFGVLVFMLTVSTVAVNVLGNEMSNAMLATSWDYIQRGTGWELMRWVPVAAILSGVLVFGIVTLLFGDVLAASAFASLSLLGCLRLVLSGLIRHAGRYVGLVCTSVSYLVAGLIGMWIIPPHVPAWVPLVTAEAAALLALLCFRPWRSVSIPSIFPLHSAFGSDRYAAFIGVALIVNFVSYGDRVLAISILGSAALSTYYAASSVGKMVAMFTNPISSSLIARLGKSGHDAIQGLRSKFFKVLLVAVPVFLVVNGLASWFGVRLLYPHEVDAAVPLILPCALAAAVSAGSDLLKPLILRFSSPHNVLALNLVYGASFIAAVTLMASSAGLIGFAWSVVVGRLVQLAGSMELIRRLTPAGSERE